MTIKIGDRVRMTPAFLQAIGPTDDSMNWIHSEGELIQVKGKLCIVRFDCGETKRIVIGNLERIINCD